MVMTRTQQVAALDHVLSVGFGLAAGSPLILALATAGYETIYDVLNMSKADIDALVYDDNGTERPVPQPRKVLLDIIIQYMFYRRDSGNPIGDDWTSLTPTDFDQFRVSPDFLTKLTDTTVPAPSTTPTTGQRQRDPVADFKKGIKRDEYKRSTIARSRVQDLSNALDEAHVPQTSDDKALFEAEEKSVFEKKLLTDDGKAVVRANEKDGDAQQVFASVRKYTEESTEALGRATTGPPSRGTREATPREASLHDTLQLQREGSGGDVDDPAADAGDSTKDAAALDAIDHRDEASKGIIIGRALTAPSPRGTREATPREASLHDTLQSQREGSGGDVDDAASWKSDIRICDTAAAGIADDVFFNKENLRGIDGERCSRKLHGCVTGRQVACGQDDCSYYVCCGHFYCS